MFLESTDQDFESIRRNLQYSLPMQVKIQEIWPVDSRRWVLLVTQPVWDLSPDPSLGKFVKYERASVEVWDVSPTGLKRLNRRPLEPQVGWCKTKSEWVPSGTGTQALLALAPPSAQIPRYQFLVFSSNGARVVEAGRGLGKTVNIVATSSHWQITIERYVEIPSTAGPAKLKRSRVTVRIRY